jgi:hypothetical protein
MLELIVALISLQLRIRIECAFGMMVQRWGILRMAMPKGLSISRIIALVNCLAKLHNFCIDEVDGSLLQSLNIDNAHMMNNEDGYVPMESSREHGVFLPRALMSAGHHFQDISRNERRQRERCNPEGTLPRKHLLQQVIDSHLKRPVVT